MSPPDKHIPYLDGWRGLAILCVFIGHFVSHARYWWIGKYGVDLFFVLSGYLMCNILFIKLVPLPDFFASRFMRVVPTFLLFIGAMLLYATTLQPEPFVPSGAEILATMSFLRTYLPHELALTSDQWPIGHLWSLNVEEHSYIFLALVALATRRLNRRWLTGAALAGSALLVWFITVAYLHSPPPGPNDMSMRTESASLGLLAAAAIRYVRHYFPLTLYRKVPGALPLLAAVAAFLCFSLYQYKGIHLTVAPLLLACAINFLDRVPELVRRCLSHPALRWLGTCSFSLYLWQQPLHVLLAKYDMNPYAMAAAAAGIGLLSFYLFENPVRKRLAAAWRSRQAGPAQTTVA